MTSLIAFLPAIPWIASAIEAALPYILGTAVVGAGAVYGKQKYEDWKEEKADEEYRQQARLKQRYQPQPEIIQENTTEIPLTNTTSSITASDISTAKFPVRRYPRAKKITPKLSSNIELLKVNPVQIEDLTPTWKIQAALEEPVFLAEKNPKGLVKKPTLTQQDLLPAPIPPERPDGWWKKFKNWRARRAAKQVQYPELYTNKGFSPTTMNLTKAWTTGAGAAVGAKAVDEGLGYLGYDPIFKWENPQYVEFKNNHPVVKALLEKTPLISSADSMIESGLSSDNTASTLISDGTFVLGNGILEKLNPVLQAKMYRQQPYLIGADVVSGAAQNQMDKSDRDKNAKLSNEFTNSQLAAISEFDMGNQTKADSLRLNNQLTGLDIGYDFSDEELLVNEEMFRSMGFEPDKSAENALNKKQQIDKQYDNSENNVILPVLSKIGDFAGFWALRNPYTITRW